MTAYDVFALPLPERALISKIAGLVGPRRSPNRAKLLRTFGAHLITGIGDDCAVLRPTPGSDLLVTTDFSLEGVHFRREWHPPESVGHRCLARGLSDIAAMGGEPAAVFLSLALPARLDQKWVNGFLSGLLKLARRFTTTLAGGDISQSPSGILADIVVLGSVPAGKPISRSGARPGDRIYVTGSLGGSAAALDLLYSKRKKITPKNFSSHFFPLPRIREAQILRSQQIPTSMIDISDGLSTDLSHICEASNVGAEIWAREIPRANTGSPATRVSFDLALHGGEDYELLFTAPAQHRAPSRIAGTPVSCIGEITRRKQIFLIDETGSRSLLKPRGWEHFRRLSDK